MTVSRKTLLIVGNNNSIDFNESDNLLDTLNANEVSISQSCGGHATCTTCRVIVLEGLENCSPRTELEAERAEERDFARNERLACQTSVYGNIKIEIANSEKD